MASSYYTSFETSVALRGPCARSTCIACGKPMTWHDEGRCSDCASARLARVAAAERRVIRLAEGWGAAVASEERRIYLMELESAVADLLAAGDAAGLAALAAQLGAR